MKKLRKCRVTLFLLIGWGVLSVLGYLEKDDLYKKFFVIYHFDGSLDDVEITYAYSPVLKGIEIVDGKPVNLQITKRGDVVTVSNPVNMGSY